MLNEIQMNPVYSSIYKSSELVFIKFERSHIYWCSFFPKEIGRVRTLYMYLRTSECSQTLLRPVNHSYCEKYKLVFNKFKSSREQKNYHFALE